ncbi:TPA: hypothetical protein U2L33_006170 [Burkholderia cenocepacia]|uniref:hypothetical protein n=1 Tax=Burkholderia cepacia complex TaxID=87882 RepID=UPI00098EAC34|nr:MULTISPECIES: hypothetical protein [Burkholderia cepacia complex]HEM7902033.1 hypothetical protein [Burkholderia cenocepacia]
MTSASGTKNVSPIVGDDSLIARLRELHEREWPAGLSRFGPFKLAGDDAGAAYRAVAWEPTTLALYVQAIAIGQSPPACRLPRPIIFETNDDMEAWLSRVTPISDRHRPAHMDAPWSEVRKSAFNGFSRRMMLINALIMVDTTGTGKESDYIVNDYVFFDSQLRNERIEQIKTAVGGGPGFRATLDKLLTKFIWYGGDQRAMLARTADRGGRDKQRLKPARKPGPLSALEQLARARAISQGKTFVRKAKRTDQNRKSKMVEAVEIDWAGKKRGLASAHRRMVKRHFLECRADDRPSYGTLYYHLDKWIAPANHSVANRYGPRATEQYIAPRPGTSSEITQGVIEILDVDGMVPKMQVGGVVKGKLEPMEISVILSVSRLSGGVRGYEILLSRERAVGYRQCLVWSLLSMADRAAALGLEPLPGLLHGNFDGLFADNGPGKGKQVRIPVTESLDASMFNPGPGKPEYRGVGERLNEIIIEQLADETDQGYTRRNSVLERVKRRERSRQSPMPLDDFERALLKAIDTINLTADRSHLRTKEMAQLGVGITPSELHEYYQTLRRGQAARVWTPEEVFDAFLPWHDAACSQGRVRYKNARYSSRELVEIATAHARHPIKRRLTVEIKRTVQISCTLLCRGPDKRVFQIEMIDEDKRRFGEGSWIQLEAATRDENILRNDLRTTRAKLSGRLKTTQQERLDAIERGRGNSFAGAAGVSKTQARKSGAAVRDRALDEVQRTAYGVPVTTSPTASMTQIERVAADEADDDPLAAAARQAEEAYLNTK